MKNSTDSSIVEQQKTLIINRTFDLPLTTVWKAWSYPDSLQKWWGPKEYTCPDCIIDFKVGGKFLASMQDKEGKKSWSTGVYKEIIPLKKIVNTDSFSDSKGNIVPAAYYNMPGDWADELLVTVELEEVDGKTHMKLQHEGLPPEMIEDCTKGWQSSLDKLEENID